MSKRKHNIAYIKPEEPKFLRELKAQAGYKEGPTIDSKKREEPPDFDEEDRDYREEEEPTVVVLKDGDLTAEEAEAMKKQKEEEETNAPADLTKRIIFKRNTTVETAAWRSDKRDPPIKRSKKTKQNKVPLSFNDQDDE